MHLYYSAFMLKHILFWKCSNFVIIFELHRLVGEITREFLVSFCAALNKCIPIFGKKKKQIALGNFLYSHFNGALLRFNNKKEIFYETMDLIFSFSKTKKKRRRRKVPVSLEGVL
jgi:hypothetical protein